MRFLIDENLPRAFRGLLQEEGHYAELVWGSPLQERDDVEIAEYAIRQNLILITRDLDFPLRNMRPLPGLVLMRLSSKATAEVLMARMGSFLDTPEFALAEGRITVVLPQRIRWRRIKDA